MCDVSGADDADMEAPGARLTWFGAMATMREVEIPTDLLVTICGAPKVGREVGWIAGVDVAVSLRFVPNRNQLRIRKRALLVLRQNLDLVSMALDCSFQRGKD